MGKYYPFESGKILYIKDIPTYSTYSDIKNWICNALYSKKTKGDNQNKIGYVYKEMNSGVSYVRFNTNSDINQCVQLIKRKALMGIYPKLIVLNDEQSSKIWQKVAEKPCNANRDVEITLKKRKNTPKKIIKENKENKESEDEDIDLEQNANKKKETLKNETQTNDKKHKLENPESSQPAKKQKTC